MPESIYFFKSYNGAVSQLNLYHPLRYGDDIECYKVRTLADGTISIQMGEGTWGKETFDTGTEFQAIWLELSNNGFSTQGNLVSEVEGSFSDDVYEVIASFEGQENDINYARQNYYQHLLNTAVVASNSQIREYVNAYSFVQDSLVVVSQDEDNKILVYIKPTDPEDIGGFDEVTAALDLYGNIFTKHEAWLAFPMNFSVVIYAVGDYNQYEITSYLVNRLAYNKLAYSEIVSASVLAAELQSLLRVNSHILFRVSHGIDVQNLMSPLQGTIQLFDDSTEPPTMVGFDSHGIIYKLVSSSSSGDILYGFGSSYGSSFLSNHFFDAIQLNNGTTLVERHLGYKNTNFNLYSGLNSVVREFASTLASNLIFDINEEVYQLNNSVDFALAGLRTKNETVDEFPVFLATFPIDSCVSDSSTNKMTSNAATVARNEFNNNYDSIAAEIGYPTSTYDVILTYKSFRVIDGPDYSSLQPGYNDVVVDIEVSFDWEAVDIQYGNDHFYGSNTKTFNDCNVVYIKDNSTVETHSKAISFNVFIDSMLWNFPDTNANTLQPIRSMLIEWDSAFDVNANEFIESFYNTKELYIGTQASGKYFARFPETLFAPRVKFLNDVLYTVVSTSAGCYLYIFNLSERYVDPVSALTAKILLSNNQWICDGIIANGRDVFIRLFDPSENGTSHNKRVSYKNGIYSLENDPTASQIESYRTFIYQSKSEIFFVKVDNSSGNVYNFSYYIADSFGFNTNSINFTDFEQLNFYCGSGPSDQMTLQSVESWTSFPQLSFINKEKIGLIWVWLDPQNFVPGTNVPVTKRTAVIVDRETLTRVKYNADNDESSANQNWKYPNYTGTVNYETGELNQGSLTATSVTYDTSLIEVKSERYYPKLNETNPVLWT